jgi:ferredoxin
MRVSANTNKCLGTGNCALVAPDVFDQDNEDGTVTLLQTEPSAEHSPAVRRAVLQCPSGAIQLTEEAQLTEDAG